MEILWWEGHESYLTTVKETHIYTQLQNKAELDKDIVTETGYSRKILRYSCIH